MPHMLGIFSSLVFWLIFFFVLISPQFLFVPYELSVVVVPVAILGILEIIIKGKLSANILYFVLPWGLSFGYVLTLYILQGLSDSEFVVGVGKLPFLFFAAHFIVNRLCKIDKFSALTIKRLSNLIFLCILAQAIAMTLSYIYPGFNSLLSLFVMKEDLDARVGGFQSLGRDSVSMNQAAGAFFICLVMLFRKERRTTRNLIYYCFGLFLILGSSVLAGRTGIFLFVASGVLFLGSKFLPVLISRPAALAKSLFLMFPAIFIILSIYPFLASYANGIVVLDYSDPVYRLLEPLRKQGEISSLEKLKGDMVIFPEASWHFLLGDGYYGRSEGVYVSSDIGYIRMIYGMGLIGLVLYLLIPASLALNVLLLGVSPLIKVAFVSFLIFGVLGHLKIVYLSSGPFFFLLSIFYFLVIKLTQRRVIA